MNMINRIAKSFNKIELNMFIFSQTIAIVNVVKEDFPFFKDLIQILIVLKRRHRKT